MSSKRATKTTTKKRSATPAKRAAVKKAKVKKVVAKKAVSKKPPPSEGRSSASIHQAPLFDPGFDEGSDPGALPLDEVHDEAEIAQHLQLQEQAAINRRAREMNRPEFHPDFDGETCVECGEDIPPARLKLLRVRCVDCQSFLEEAAERRRRLQG